MIKTIHLTNSEVSVVGLDGQHVHIRNFGSTSVYVSKTPGIVPDTDGVLRISGGTSGTLSGVDGVIHLIGSDEQTVLIYSTDDIRSPFN